MACDSFLGNSVRLKFFLQQALLYAFQFVGTGSSREAVRLVGQEPWKTTDLDRLIEVGVEIISEDNGERLPITAPNKKCARCELMMGEFELARVFQPPPGKQRNVHFHETCLGNIRLAQ